MKKLISLALLLFYGPVLSQQLKEADRNKILQTLEEQRIAWNNGDLEKYMEGYWKSDSLRFIGRRGVQYGWHQTLSNYRRNYPDKKAMGILTFEIISLEALSDKAAFMIGRWSLDKVEGSPQGYFTLIWKKIGGKWLVAADHSS